MSTSAPRTASLRARLRDDSGMSTVEYAIGTLAAAAFAAVLYAVVTTDGCALSSRAARGGDHPYYRRARRDDYNTGRALDRNGAPAHAQPTTRPRDRYVPLPP